MPGLVRTSKRPRPLPRSSGQAGASGCSPAPITSWGWEAGAACPGVRYVPCRLTDSRVGLLLDDVRRERGDVDLLIVSLHWGPNWDGSPPPAHVALAHALVDAGADVIFGHSPHVVRGVEVYRNRPIIYGAGDFIDDYAVDPAERNDWSCLFVLDCDREGLQQMLLYPMHIEDLSAWRAQGLWPGRSASEWP